MRLTITTPAKLLSQGLKFGAVGLAATLVHVSAFVLWIEAAGMPPLAANVAAFCIAVGVGFLGHFHWTFTNRGEDASALWKGKLSKFIIVSLIGLLLNSLIVYVIVNVLFVHYFYAGILMVTLVPGCLFLLSRFWAFA